MFERRQVFVYHLLGFVAFVLGAVFILTVGSNDYGLGYYFFELRVAVIFFFMAGLFALAKWFGRKLKEREKGSAQLGANDEEKEVKDNSRKDLYLISEWEGEEIRYKVENGDKEAVYHAVGRLSQGKVESIEFRGLEAGSGATVLVIRSQSIKGYTVLEGEQVLGTIKVRKGDVRFLGADDTVRYSMSFAEEDIPEDEQAAMGILALGALYPIDHGPKANIVLIKDCSDAVMGKYYFPLRNLELTGDRNNSTDRRIAVILVVMADIRLQVAKMRKRA